MSGVSFDASDLGLNGASSAFRLEIRGGIIESLTLRDYFAAKALDGMLSSPRTPGQISWGELAAHSYAAADAMLAERGREAISE